VIRREKWTKSDSHDFPFFLCAAEMGLGPWLVLSCVGFQARRVSPESTKLSTIPQKNNQIVHKNKKKRYYPQDKIQQLVNGYS
jgi:hypothetical protein